jgi:hypothetical protein
LFGIKLEKLDVLRRSYKVNIQWDQRRFLFKINSENLTADSDIIAAIRGIRRLIRDADAKEVFAQPVYIVVPPTTLKQTVRPRFIGNNLSIELAGEQVSEREQALWKDRKDALLVENFRKFRDLLAKNLVFLQHLRGWMRMRVHFGDVLYERVHEKFLVSKSHYSLEDFTKMVEESGCKINFDRKYVVLSQSHDICRYQTRLIFEEARERRTCDKLDSRHRRVTRNFLSSKAPLS